MPDGASPRILSVNGDPARATAVATTAAPVMMRSADGFIDEVLVHEPDAVDLSRFVGAPVLNAHRQDDARHVLGRVESAQIKNGQIIAELVFSQRADVSEFVRDIQSGILNQVSTGYKITKWRMEKRNGRPTRVALCWSPFEISLVPVSASLGTVLYNIRSIEMDGEVKTDEVSKPEAEPISTVTIEGARSIAGLAGLDDKWANDVVARGLDDGAARAEALSVLSARSAAPIRREATPDALASPTFDDPIFRARAMGEALYCRVNPGHSPSEPAREFVGMTISDMAGVCLSNDGVTGRRAPGVELITRALHATGDFPLILGEAANRTLKPAYEAAQSPLKALARQSSARDFRLKHRVALGEAPTLKKVVEGGSIERGAFAEAEETYKIDSFARIVSISRPAMVNDDLGAFANLAETMGRAAALFEADQLIALLTSASGAGPTMGDGTALFHADHANLAGTGGAPDVATLGAARLAMRSQTGIDGRTIINVAPHTLLVPAALETVAEQLVATLTPSTTSEVNPFSGRLQVAVDPRLDAVSAATWYVVADSARFEGLEYAYLDSRPGPQIETRNGFDMDGVEIKVSLDFGAGFVDWRSWYQNPGS